MEVLFLVAIVVGVILIYLHNRRERERTEARWRAVELSGVDQMAGRTFEEYVERLLRHKGYRTRLTKVSGDFGVDIVATGKDGQYAIQCKRSSGRVSRRAVSDAVAGKQHYGCSRSMVITNSWFTQGAQRLAASTGCKLIDRDKITDWIVDFQGKAAVESENHERAEARQTR
ncbi:MAG: restriction endonuclease [Thermodesulfobacteriota bacterium]